MLVNNSKFYMIPKTGLTRVRGWLGPYHQEKSRVQTRWCILRNPYSRFCSAYSNIILKQGCAEWMKESIGNTDIYQNNMYKLLDDLLNKNYNDMTPFTSIHFTTQLEALKGGKMNLYFKFEEMDTVKRYCEFLTNTQLSPFRINKSQSSDILLNTEHAAMLKEIYKDDFEFINRVTFVDRSTIWHK
jgi:hypothetical protein